MFPWRSDTCEKRHGSRDRVSRNADDCADGLRQIERRLAAMYDGSLLEHPLDLLQCAVLFPQASPVSFGKLFEA